ncbi:MAG TPA: GNAT family N-acetyltransferase, partial [Cyclobacteriaceae bacterium]
SLDDYDQWLEFFKDPASFIHWKSEQQSPEKECSDWYEKQFNRYEFDRGGMNALIEKSSGKLIGHCGLLVQQVDGITELEIGYSLLLNGRNKGYATEAAMKCKEYAFANNLTSSLISIISLTNQPSMNVAVKNGMKPEKQTVYNGNEVMIYRILATKPLSFLYLGGLKI